MAKNYLLPFAQDSRANVVGDSAWESYSQRKTGFESGIARSDYCNRVWAQGAAAGNVIGEFITDVTGRDASLTSDLVRDFRYAIAKYVPDNIANGSIAERKLEQPVQTKLAQIGTNTNDIAGLKKAISDGFNLLPGCISNLYLAANAVTTDKIKDKAVTKDKLEKDIVTAVDKVSSNTYDIEQLRRRINEGFELAPGSIRNLHLSYNCVNASNISAGAVTARTIGSKAVTESALADFCVTKRTIADRAVTADKLDTSAVNTGALASGAVTRDKLDASVRAELDTLKDIVAQLTRAVAKLGKQNIYL